MSKHVVTNSADEAQIAKAADWQDDVARDLDTILGINRGRRFLYMLIFDTCHAEQRSHVPGDPESTAFNEGARMVGQELLARIRDRNFDAYIKMLEENQSV